MGVYICFLSKCIIDFCGQKKYLPNVENSKKTFKEAGYQTFLEVQSEDLLDDTSFRVVEDRDKVLEFRVKKRWKNDYFLFFFQ